MKWNFVVLLNRIKTLTSRNTSWKTGKNSDGCKIRLKTYLVKSDDLLSILNCVNNDIQFSMRLSDNKLSFLDILITKSGKECWMNIYSKSADPTKATKPLITENPALRIYVWFSKDVQMLDTWSLRNWEWFG